MFATKAPAAMSYHNIYSNRYEATSKAGQSFWKMMLVWKGSVLKLIWMDLVIIASVQHNLVLFSSPDCLRLLEVVARFKICILRSRTN